MKRAPLTEAELFSMLEQLEIPFALHRHPPCFTVEESRECRSDLPGVHVKNMFLKDKKGRFWLVTCLEDRRIKIRDLEKTLATQKMSFAKPEAMSAVIGVSPGAVTPMAAANAGPDEITVVLDSGVTEAETIHCHPLHNEATIALSSKDLARFLNETGHLPRVIDFDELERRNDIA